MCLLASPTLVNPNFLAVESTHNRHFVLLAVCSCGEEKQTATLFWSGDFSVQNGVNVYFLELMNRRRSVGENGKNSYSFLHTKRILCVRIPDLWVGKCQLNESGFCSVDDAENARLVIDKTIPLILFDISHTFFTAYWYCINFSHKQLRCLRPYIIVETFPTNNYWYHNQLISLLIGASCFCRSFDCVFSIIKLAINMCY